MGKEWGDTLRTGGKFRNSSVFSSWTEKYKEGEVDQLKRLEEISGQTDVELSQPS